MAGTMRKMAEYLGLVETDLEADLGTQEEPRPRAREPYVPAAPEPRPRVVAEAPTRSVTPATTAVAERPTPPVTTTPRAAATSTLRPTGAVSGTDTYRITTLHPRSYNDARLIGEEYREGVPVILNLTGMDDNDAKRIVDFAAGLIFGLRGSIERVTQKVFLLSPANVDVGAEARAQIAQDGFFNQS
jgi:cell division inhibitor SepF